MEKNLYGIMHCLVLYFNYIFAIHYTYQPMNLENTKAQMRKGILEFCILSILRSETKYASEILDSLKKSEMLVVEGTLYPLLTRLKNAALLEYRWEESNAGPPRKYYQITPLGTQMLQELNLSWKSLQKAVNSILKIK